MKTTLVLCLVLAAVLLYGNGVVARNNQLLNRYSRNLLRRSGAMGGGGNGGGGNGGIEPSNQNNNVNEYDAFNALFGIGSNMGNLRATGVGQQQSAQLLPQQLQQSSEVYGIVEPLIEDMPCMDRPCTMNDHCCPTGVCVNTYGEGKCIYVYGRKRDLCYRNIDCEAGTVCLKDATGIMICQPSKAAIATGTTTNAMRKTGGYEMGKQFGDECLYSSECNLAKGMCCQMQRSHHRVLPKRMCAYFRDPFVCIDVMPTDEDEEEMRRTRFSTNLK